MYGDVYRRKYFMVNHKVTKLLLDKLTNSMYNGSEANKMKNMKTINKLIEKIKTWYTVYKFNKFVKQVKSRDMRGYTKCL